MNTSVADDSAAMLADSASRYFERGYTTAIRARSLASEHGVETNRWGEIADMGWLALPLEASDDGLDGSVSDLCVLAEAMGRALLVEPWLACSVIAAPLLAQTATAEQKGGWLAAITAGQKRAAFAAWDAGSRFDATRIQSRAERHGDGYRLTGRKELVLGAPGADLLLVSAVCDEPGSGTTTALFMVEPGTPGLDIRGYAMVDGRHAAHLAFDQVLLPPQSRLGAAHDTAQTIRRVMDRATLTACAETVGAMARSMEVTLEYLKIRKQFGRVLASNQALQHRLVDMFVAIEESRALVQDAALHFDTSDSVRRTWVAAAKAYTAQAARLVWEEAVQMHGAIGMSEEYVLGAYVRHLAAAHTLFGDVDHHLEDLAQSEDQLFASC